MSREGKYIHGFTNDEQARLTRMQDILNSAQLAALDLSGVRQVLDVGSGLGQMTRAIARQLPEDDHVVIGVETSQQQLDEASRQAAVDDEQGLVEFRQGDATSLPLADHEAGSFDLVHARFLLEHVTDPLAVVREMVRAARVGGQIVLLDDDHELLRVWPECPALQNAWEIYWRSYYDLGFDPLVGRRLGGLLHEAGVEEIRLDTVFYGAHFGHELFVPVIENLIGVINSAAELLDDRGLLSPEDWAAAVDEIGGWSNNPSASLWYSLPMAIGVRRR